MVCFWVYVWCKHTMQKLLKWNGRLCAYDIASHSSVPNLVCIMYIHIAWASASADALFCAWCMREICIYIVSYIYWDLCMCSDKPSFLKRCINHCGEKETIREVFVGFFFRSFLLCMCYKVRACKKSKYCCIPFRTVGRIIWCAKGWMFRYNNNNNIENVPNKCERDEKLLFFLLRYKQPENKKQQTIRHIRCIKYERQEQNDSLHFFSSSFIVFVAGIRIRKLYVNVCGFVLRLSDGV